MTHSLSGKWKAGWALDLHTLSSTLNSDGSYTIGKLIRKVVPVPTLLLTEMLPP